MSERIGFVGVGRMGANMARRLKDVGYKVTAVYDINTKGAQELAAELGSEACTKLARVTELSDVIITVVTDDKAQLNIFTNKKDNLLMGAKGRVFVNCATISPAVHVQVEKLAKKEKAASLEGCMAFSKVENTNARGQLLEASARALLAAGKKIKAIETFDTLLQSGIPDTWKDRINKELDQMADDF